MNSNNFRVSDPPYDTPAKNVSKQLRKDMLESAIALRNVLYGIPQSVGLKIALEALDFPHFIPIENTEDALFQEMKRLDDLFWDYIHNDFDNPARNAIRVQCDDIHEELKRRDFYQCEVK